MVGEKGVVPVPPPHGLDRCMGLAKYRGLFVQVGGCEVLFFSCGCVSWIFLVLSANYALWACGRDTDELRVEEGKGVCCPKLAGSGLAGFCGVDTVEVGWLVNRFPIS